MSSILLFSILMFISNAFLDNITRIDWATRPLLYAASGIICGYESQQNIVWLLGGNNNHEKDIMLFDVTTKNLTYGPDTLNTTNIQLYADGPIYVQDSSEYLWMLSYPNGEYFIKYDLLENHITTNIQQNNITPNEGNQGCLAHIKHSADEYLMIVSGPIDSDEFTQSEYIQLYSINQDLVISTTWTSLSIPRRFHACIVSPYNNYMYVFGGYSNNIKTQPKTIEKFDVTERIDFETNGPTSSNTANEFSTGKQYWRAVAYEKYVILAGDNKDPDYIFIFNVETEEISIDSFQTDVESFDNSVKRPATIIVGHTLYLFGGQNLANLIRSTWQFQDLDPTASPTQTPTNDPTAGATTTLSPTETPTTTLQPTLAPTINSYITFFIETNMEYNAMILPTYQNNVIVAITSVIYKYLNVFSLEFLNVLECDKSEYGWQYIVQFSHNKLNILTMLFESNITVQNEIQVAIQELNVNDGYNIILNSVMFAYNNIITASICINTITTNEPTESISEKVEISDNFATYSYLVLAAVVVIPVIIFIVACIVHNCKAYKGTDGPDFKALFRYFANLGDFWSDILFAFHLNAVESYLFFWAALFTFIPYVFSIILLIGFIYISRSSGTSKYINISKYLHEYDYILIGLSLIGGLFPSLSICSSKLFHAKIFSLDFREDQTSKIQIFRFFNITAVENCPQLIIQIIFASQTGFKDAVTIISMFFSILSLLMGFIRTISVTLDRRHSTIKTDDVDKRLGDWLKADTILSLDENQDVNIDPNILFKVNIKSQYLRENHKYTRKILTKLICDHIGVDKTCLELFGFNMINNNNLQFYVEIQLVKLMRFEVDLTNTKFSKLNDKMVNIGSQNDNDNNNFTDNLIDKLHLNSNIKEIAVVCEHINDAKTMQLVSTTSN